MSEPRQDIDAERVVRRVGERAAAALVESWIKVAVLEEQLAALQGQPGTPVVPDAAAD